MRHKASRFEVKVRNRSNTASIVAAAAYCTGGRYHCDRTGKVKNYSRRRDVVSVESIKLPNDPEKVFNAACSKEKHPRARLAREILVSLPHELPLKRQRVLVRGFCLWMHDRYGMSSMAAIHHPLAHGLDQEILRDMIPMTEGQKEVPKLRKDERGNPLNQHVHILCPTRFWNDETGSFGQKIRDLDGIVSGPQIVQEMRDEWQKRVNRELTKANVPMLVDLRSYEKAAANGDAPGGLTPQPKMGPRNTARKRRRILENGSDDTHLGKTRAKIQAKNEELWKSWLLIRDLEREKARLKDSELIAAKNETARLAKVDEANTNIEAARTADARAKAIENAPHLDTLDPTRAAILWAQGRMEKKIDPKSDRTIDPETETAATPESKQQPRFAMSQKAKQRARPPRQRQRKIGS
ncbi:MobA/MobL family protein [Sulfitobacter faviae]|uniref:MobA/MobL family protein n=1 Tax=Sulfitobacter faviae TaxID=1775881 RepID=A0AAX3LLT2_9RHOB|nr:MobA/MobL family protein [Sulfitobacter faviae]WCE69472.1 MobA/MobL family protein [Sulfitobacter faviae]